MSEIRRFARQVAERFHPEKIILFGSHAYGTPHADSDVDILVIMPARNRHDQAYKIRDCVSAPIVRWGPTQWSCTTRRWKTARAWTPCRS